MKIFKLFFQIIKEQRMYLLGSLVMFVSFVFFFAVSQQAAPFNYLSLKIALDDQDQSDISEGLVRAFKQHHEVMTEPMTEADMRDAVYQEAIQLAVRIPHGFGQAFADNAPTSLDIIAGSAEQDRKLVQSEAAQYLASLSVYAQLQGGRLDGKAGRYAIEETLKIMQDEPHGEIMTTPNRISDQDVHYLLGLIFLDYLMLALPLTLLRVTILQIDAVGVRQRIRMSAYPAARIMVEIFCASFLLMTLIWGMFILVLTGVKQAWSILPTAVIQWALLGSFVHMLACTALSLFVTYLIFNNKILEFFKVLFCLAIAFSSGIFVGRQFIHQKIYQFSSIFPSYWHVKTIYDSFETVSFGAEQIQGYENSIVIMLLMMLAYFSLSIFFRRYQLNRADA